MPRRISSVRRGTSFAAARRRAIACSATETLYAPALPQTIAAGGNRSNGRWATPATRDWIIRTFRAFSRKSGGNSRGKPIDTTTSAVAQASPRFSAGRSSRTTGSNAPEAFRVTTSRRSASIGATNRTRAIGRPETAVGLGPFDGARSALRVPARVALDAAFLEDEGLAALRALGIQAFLQQLRGVAGLLLQFDVRFDGAPELVERLDGRLHAGLLHADVPLDRLRDRVGDRVDALSMVDRDPRAADALELVDDLVDRDAGSEAQRHESGDPFREGRRVAATAADLREDLEETFLVLVDGDVEVAVSREDLLGAACDDVRAGAGPQGRGLRRNFDADLLRLLRLRDADVQDLVLAGAVAVHGDAFAVQLIGQEVRFLHVLHGRLPRQVDRFRHRGVAPVLERRLHANVPLGCDIVRRGEDALPFLGDLFEASRGPVVVEDLLHQVVPPETFALRDLLEVVEEVRELFAVHDAFVPDQAELRLAAAGCVGNHRERAGGRDGCDVGIADMQALLLVTAALPSGIDSAILRALCALIISGFLDKSHNLAAPFDPLLGVVRDLEHEEHAGEAHDTEADLAGGPSHLLDFLDRICVHVDDVVEHADRGTNRSFESLPVDVPSTRGIALHVTREINGSKVAGLVRQERLFPALSYHETIAYHGV